MPVKKIRNKKTGEVRTVNVPYDREYSPEEIISMGTQQAPQSQATPQGAPTDMEVQKDPFLQRNAPMIGDVAGGFLGPVGAGLGFSIGHSIKTILDELQNIGPMGGKGAELTEFGQQRAREEGMGEGPEKFSLAKEAAKNAFSKEGASRAGRFLGQNLGGAATSFATDLALGGFGSESKLIKNLADKSPVLKAIGNIPTPGGGTVKQTEGLISKAFKLKSPLHKVKGLTPNSIVESGNQVKKQIWNTIESQIDEATESGKLIDITDLVSDLSSRKAKILETWGSKADVPNSVMSKIDGIDEVLGDLTKGARQQGGNLFLTPSQAQALKETFGEQSFTGITKLLKAFTDPEAIAAQRSRQTAGGELSSSIKSLLKELGLDDVEKLYKSYGKLSEDVGSLSRKGVFEGWFPSATTAGAVSALTPISFGSALIPAYLANSPYGRQISRQAVRNLVAPTLDIGQRAGIGSLLQSLGREND